MSGLSRDRHKKKDGLSAIAFWQFMAFILLILCIWMNEIVDVAMLWFGVEPSQPNFFRACVLTAMTVVVAVVTVGHTYMQQKRVIKGLLTVCADCRKIRVNNDMWEQLDQYVSDHSMALISHGLCPHCFEKAQREIHEAVKGSKPAE